MNSRLLNLAARRGELKVRIEMQRQDLALHSVPVAEVLAKVDRVAKGVEWVKDHPGAIGAAVAAVAVLRPRRTWRLARRVFLLWQSWKALRRRLPPGLI